MADIAFYKKHLGLTNTDQICGALTETLIQTNCTYDFFVNWSKVTANRDAFKYELALLKSLKNSTNPTSDFSDLLTKYPEVIKVIPILVACREGILKVLDSLDSGLSYKTFNFTAPKNLQLIDDVTQFAKNTGLLDILCTMDSATDYLLGVEVGLDTNARKNRSGTFLETLVFEALSKLTRQNSKLILIEQKTFGYVQKNYGISIPTALQDRKFDYAVLNGKEATTIEVNFYSGTGSKPSEIVSSYCDRNRLLKDAGWKFIWLTDGQGWLKMKRPLRVGVDNISYVFNTKYLRDGLFEKVIIQ